MIIWVNEQIDPCGLVQACIACQDEQAAKDCDQSWLTSLTDEQKQGFLCAVVGGSSGDDEFLGERVVSGAPSVCVLGPPSWDSWHELEALQS